MTWCSLCLSAPPRISIAPISKPLKRSFKTRFLDLFRRIFRIRCLEACLAQLADGRPIGHVICKMIPAHYLYPAPSIRIHIRDGLRLKLDISDYIDHGLFFGFRGDEDESYRNLMKLVEPHYNCIDVGTKNGYVSLRMACLAYKGRTLGFEPDPVNYRQSIDNLELNSANNLSIQNTGLGDRRIEGTMEVRVATNRGGNRIANGAAEGVSVRIERLDDILKSIGCGPVNLIKIDVEGYELKVLRGAESILRDWKPILFIEVDDANLSHQGDSASAMVLFLNELGYDDLKHAETGEDLSAKSSYVNLHIDLIARG
mgnify:FL=1